MINPKQEFQILVMTVCVMILGAPVLVLGIAKLVEIITGR